MKFKHERDKKRFNELCEPLKYALHEVDFYFTVNGFEFIITETWTTEQEDRAVGRKEMTHREFRAADARSKHLPNEFKKEVLTRFNHVFNDWGALSRKSGKRVFCVLHGDGDNEHFHFQLRKDYSKINIPKELLAKAETIGGEDGIH